MSSTFETGDLTSASLLNPVEPAVSKSSVRSSDVPSKLVHKHSGRSDENLSSPAGRIPAKPAEDYSRNLRYHASRRARDMDNTIVRRSEDRQINLAVNRMVTWRNVGIHSVRRTKGRSFFDLFRWKGGKVSKGTGSLSETTTPKSRLQSDTGPAVTHVQRSLAIRNAALAEDGDGTLRAMKNTLEFGLDPMRKEIEAHDALNLRRSRETQLDVVNRTMSGLDRLKGQLRELSIAAHAQLAELEARRDKGVISGNEHNKLEFALLGSIATLDSLDSKIDELRQSGANTKQVMIKEGRAGKSASARPFKASGDLLFSEFAEGLQKLSVEASEVHDDLNEAWAGEPLFMRKIAAGEGLADQVARARDSRFAEHAAKKRAIQAYRKAPSTNANIAGKAMFASAVKDRVGAQYEARCRDMLSVSLEELGDTLETGQLKHLKLSDENGRTELGQHFDRASAVAEKIGIRRGLDDLTRQKAELTAERAEIEEQLHSMTEELDEVLKAPNAIGAQEEKAVLEDDMSALRHRRNQIDEALGQNNAIRSAIVKQVRQDGITEEELPPLHALREELEQPLNEVLNRVRQQCQTHIEYGSRQISTATAALALAEEAGQIADGLESVQNDHPIDIEGGISVKVSDAELSALHKDLVAEVRDESWRLDVGLKGIRKFARSVVSFFGFAPSTGRSDSTRATKDSAKSQRAVAEAKRESAFREGLEGAEQGTEAFEGILGLAEMEMEEELPDIEDPGHGDGLDGLEADGGSGDGGIEAVEKNLKVDSKAVEDASQAELDHVRLEQAATAISTSEYIVGFATSVGKIAKTVGAIKHKKQKIARGEQLARRHDERLKSIPNQRVRSDVKYATRVQRHLADHMREQSFGDEAVKLGVASASALRYGISTFKSAYTPVLTAVAPQALATAPLIGAATSTVELVNAAHEARQAHLEAAEIDAAARNQRADVARNLAMGGLDLDRCFGTGGDRIKTALHAAAVAQGIETRDVSAARDDSHQTLISQYSAAGLNVDEVLAKAVGRPDFQHIENQLGEAVIDADTRQALQGQMADLAQCEALVDFAHAENNMTDKMLLVGVKGLTAASYTTASALVLAGAAGGVTILGPVGAGVAAGAGLAYFGYKSGKRNYGVFKQDRAADLITDRSNPAIVAANQKKAAKNGLTPRAQAVEMYTQKDRTAKARDIVATIRDQAEGGVVGRDSTGPLRDVPGNLPTEMEKELRATLEQEIEAEQPYLDDLLQEWNEITSSSGSVEEFQQRTKNVEDRYMKAFDRQYEKRQKLAELNAGIAKRIVMASPQARFLVESGKVSEEVILAIAEADPKMDDYSAALLVELL